MDDQASLSPESKSGRTAEILANVRISALPYRLSLTTLKKQSASCHLPHLLRLIFFPSTDRRFVSLTETEEELSLIIDDESLNTLPQDTRSSLTFHSSRWRAIQIYEGADALSETGIVSSIAAPLYKLQLNVLYLSLYNSDLIFVEENNLEKAQQCLEEGLSKSLKEKQTSEPKNVEFSLSILPQRLRLASLPQGKIEKYAYSLLRLFLSPERTDRFFSYTVADDEISLIIPEDDFEIFTKTKNEDLAVNPQIWTPVLATLGSVISLSQSEIVHALADGFARNGFSLFYVGTSNSDYALVYSESVDEAIKPFSSRDVK